MRGWKIIDELVPEGQMIILRQIRPRMLQLDIDKIRIIPAGTRMFWKVPDAPCCSCN